MSCFNLRNCPDSGALRFPDFTQNFNSKYMDDPFSPWYKRAHGLALYINKQ